MEKINTRQELGKLFQHHSLYGRGVEIGVKEGWNALNILKDYKGDLYLVDIWDNIDDFNHCKELLRDYLHRVTFMRCSSIDAAELFNSNDLDFVYIDADHKYKSVKSDHESWESKVRKGGIISGHDYSIQFQGVMKFVDELSKTEKVFFTDGDLWEGVAYESWYYFKQ